MPSLFSREKAVPRWTKLSSALALLLWAPLVIAQNNLGELLDAGAKKMSTEEFRQEVVQRLIVGPTSSGAMIEVIYASSGAIQGRAYTIQEPQSYTVLPSIDGDWKIDDKERICVSMWIGKAPLPYRCQFWFKYAEQYFISDSDSDRRTRVLRRTLKQ
jgi:hypothetical protein